MEDKETQLNKGVVSAKGDYKKQLDHEYTNNRQNYFLKKRKPQTD